MLEKKIDYTEFHVFLLCFLLPKQTTGLHSKFSYENHFSSWLLFSVPGNWSSSSDGGTK